jgi:hypothetical protein
MNTLEFYQQTYTYDIGNNLTALSHQDNKSLTVSSYHNNRVNHQHQKLFFITPSNGDWIRR